MKFQNLAEVTEYLGKFIPLVSEVTGKDITIERMRPIMKVLGNPEKRLKVIHIAGTSGKTSTTYYISSLLVATGKKVGTTVSPHIDKITERVQINGRPIEDLEFCNNVAIFADIIEKSGLVPTYFEFLIAFAYWYFAREKVDYAVVETGFGGLEDSTNIAENPSKVCVITDIGYDHMQILGNTLPEIAFQKAGIIHQGNQVFMFRQAPNITSVFQKRVKEKNGKLEFVKLANSELTKNMPEFQKRNWQLAYSTFKYIARRDDLKALDHDALIASTNVKIPARMDITNVGVKNVVMDGAHNGQKMESFIKAFKKKFGDIKVPVLLSLKRGKEHADVLPQIKSIASELIITSFSLVQDTVLHSTDLNELRKAANDFGIKKVRVIKNQDEALDYIMTTESGTVVITGSFYLISQLRGAHPELRSRRVKLVAAIDGERGIAKSRKGTPGYIPWREKVPADQKHFRELIKDGPVVMGFNTYKANMRKPFGRGINIVFSKSALKNSTHIKFIKNAEKFFKNNVEDIWVIGGGQIFELALPYATELHLTRVEGTYGCDVFFPEFEKKFALISQGPVIEENGVRFRFQTWNRKA